MAIKSSAHLLFDNPKKQEGSQQVTTSTSTATTEGNFSLYAEIEEMLDETMKEKQQKQEEMDKAWARMSKEERERAMARMAPIPRGNASGPSEKSFFKL
jgi:acyl-CoA reductase-like NAD-dependent aldehyde dehydrogenase